MLNLKSLFKDKEAVSPVIGVVLMVAITVILAAAIGSSVFGQGTTESAPQANLNVKQSYDGTEHYIVIEHLGGDRLDFSSNTTTKLTAYNQTGAEVDCNYTQIKDIGNFEVGETAKIQINSTSTSTVNAGDIVNIKIIDVATMQVVCDQDVTFSA